MRLQLAERIWDIADDVGSIESAAIALTNNPDVVFSLGLARLSGDPKAVNRFVEACEAHIRHLGTDPHDVALGVRGVIRNRDVLLRSPHLFDIGRLGCPAIAVGSGPSVVKHLDALRQLQHSCLLVIACTAEAGLRKAGIEPHVTCPLERDADLHKHLPSEHGEVTYAGSMFVAPDIVDRFRHHVLVPQNVACDRWIDERGVGYGDSSGTMSVTVAHHLTTGKVYLVGHDLCFDGESHWADSTSTRLAVDAEILGNDGKMHPTSHYLRTFATTVSCMALDLRNIVNVNAVDRTGAYIPGTLSEPLPLDLGPIRWTPPGKIGMERLFAFERKLSCLRSDIETAIALVRSASDLSDLDVPRLCTGGNQPVIELTLRPGIAQLSFERMLGLSRERSVKAAQVAHQRALEILLSVIGDSI